MSDLISTKALVKAVKGPARDYGVADEVRSALQRVGVTFAVPRWSDRKGGYKGTFKLTDDAPEYVNADHVAAAARRIPSDYSELRQAVDGLLEEATPAADAAATTNVNTAATIPTRDFVAVVQSYGDRYDWCTSAEGTMERSLGLSFVDDDEARYQLRRGNPENLTPNQVRTWIEYVRADYGTVTGVRDLIEEVRTRWLRDTPTTANAGRTSATSTGRGYRVTVETTLTTSQLRSLGWNGTSELDGLSINYAGITGRIVTHAAV